MASLFKSLGLYKSSLPFTKAPIPTQDIETAAEKRPRTLKHLIKANHANFRLLLEDGVPNALSYVCFLYRNNQMANLLKKLGCAYFLNASWQQLNEIYEVEERELTACHGQWRDAPSEIYPEHWMDTLGKPEYTCCISEEGSDGEADIREHMLTGWRTNWWNSRMIGRRLCSSTCIVLKSL
jgi:hypothetical protein